MIGPAEELFWRGLIQAALMRRFGRWRGAALAADVPLRALIVRHVAWDVWIFLVQPTGEIELLAGG